jgi:O-antigen ligase
MDIKQVARWIALGALFLVPLTPLIVANTLFFPFITGKAFYFRILVEVAFGAWVILALADARYRPRFSWILISVLAFVGWMFIADLFALNVEKAFWSNFERMEGWVLLAHLAAFFIASSSVLRVDNKWRAWFLTSLGVSLVVLGYAFLQATGVWTIHQGQTRLDASFGNSIYLAIYLLFNTFIAGWLAFTENRAWLKWSLLALAGVSIVFIFLTQTRGTIIALIGALILAAVLTMVASGKNARRVAAGVLIAILLLVGGFVAVRNTPVVRNSELWNRIASISLHDGETRFTLWHMAWQGFLERPVVGWGQEGFNYVFNKYYDPSLYAQEPWFDRAHNAFIDWLMAGGLPAFLLYLSLFGVAIATLWRSPLARAERIALTCVLAGYSFHNIFVFDNLYSYVYFFAILALIDSQVIAESPQGSQPKELAAAAFVLPIASAVVLVLAYLVNAPGLGVASGLIHALSPQQNGLTVNAQIFTDLAAHPSFAGQEVREQVVSFALQAVQSKDISNATKAQIATLAVTEMEKQVAAYPQDAREHLELALAYRTVGNVEGVLKEIDAALALSPNKEQILLQKGLTLFEIGKVADAEKVLDAAYVLAPQSPEIATYAALGDFATGDSAGGNAIIATHPEITGAVEAMLKQISAVAK